MSQPSQPQRNGRQRRPRPKQPAGQNQPQVGAAMVEHSSSQPVALLQTSVAPTVSTHLSNVRFDSLKGRVDDRLLSAIAFPLMSEVQAATLEPALSGADVLAQAKTGTGKTIAFLLPTINRLLRQPSSVPGKISCLIMSPTRELALQIEKEAGMLLRNVDSKLIGVQHVVGGTNMKSEERNLANRRCDILVATPGRLLDHLQNTPGMVGRFSALQVYTLDEADRMLDMGFRQELNKIAKFLPNRRAVPRQALLFSATIPPGVREVADLDANAQFINTLSEEEANTHAHVAQQYVIAPDTADMFPLTLALLLEELKRAPDTAKVIVFAPTARAAGLAAEVFRSRAITSLLPLGFSVGEVHSRKSQPARIKATQEFAQTRRGILFSSDVAARGVDFPGVTAVFQVGLPASAEQYIHRIGRTGRAGAEGQGIIVLAQFEAYFLQKREIKELPLTAHQAISAELMQQSRAATRQALLSDVSDESKAQAYQASLGYYKSELKSLKWNAARLVQEMNAYAKEALFFKGGTSDLAPPLLAKTVGKMGIKGTPGLNVVKDLGGRPGQANGGGRNGGGGGPKVPANGSAMNGPPTTFGNGGPKIGGGGGAGGQPQGSRNGGKRKRGGANAALGA